MLGRIWGGGSLPAVPELIKAERQDPQRKLTSQTICMCKFWLQLRDLASIKWWRLIEKDSPHISLYIHAFRHTHQ